VALSIRGGGRILSLESAFSSGGDALVQWQGVAKSCLPVSRHATAWSGVWRDVGALWLMLAAPVKRNSLVAVLRSVANRSAFPVRTWERPSSKRAGSSGGVSTVAYPNFTVAITAILQLGFPMHYRYTGSWNLPDSFAGQRVPDDFGTLTFLMPNCMLMSAYGVATYTYTGVSTNRGYLKAANGHAPIFGVRDYTTNFMSQADHGLMAVTVTNNCTSAQQVTADFIYEGNAGGGVVGVTAGWGFLSVTYTGGPIAAQRGTAPIYKTF